MLLDFGTAKVLTGAQDNAVYAMADFWADGGNHDEAIADLREALALLNRLGRRADPEQVFWVKNYLAWHLSWMRRDMDEAEILIQQAIDVGKREPRIAKGDLSEAETHQGDLLLIQGRNAEAKAIYEEALRLGRQDDPGGYWERVPLHALVSVEAASGNFRAAADYARQGYELYRKYSGDENPYTAQSKDTLGTLSCRSWSVGRGGCRGRARCHVGGARRFARGSRWISSAVWERSARIQFGEASPGGGIVCACGSGDHGQEPVFRRGRKARHSVPATRRGLERPTTVPGGNCGI